MVSIEKIFPAEGRKLLLQSRTPGIIYQTRMMNAVEWLAPFRFPPEGGIEYIPPENMEPLALLLKRNSDAALLEEILETLERTSAWKDICWTRISCGGIRSGFFTTERSARSGWSISRGILTQGIISQWLLTQGLRTPKSRRKPP